MKIQDRKHHRPEWVMERMQRSIDALLGDQAQSQAFDRPPPPPGSLDKYEGELSEQQLAHLLRRCLTGVRPEDMRRFEGASLDEVLDALFTPQSDPAPPVNDYVDREEGEVDPQVPYGETWINHNWDTNWESGRTTSLKTWWLRLFLNQEASIHMRMHLFLHSLLVIQTWDIFYGKVSYNYWNTLYQSCFGSFRTLMKDITIDAGMLWYLNGAANSKEAPDENYARELQELFCIGKGPDSGYTEGDVQMAAKVLTGWKVSWPDAQVSFAAWDHDTSDKQFSAFYGNRVISGRSGQAGQEETDDLLDMIFDVNETAKYLARRLYTFFVYPEIDAATESEVIAPLADQIRSNGYNLSEALRTLLSSQHFMHEHAIGAIIKNPIDDMIGAMRMLGAGISNDQELDDRYLQSLGLLWQMGDLGLMIGDPPSVAGWPAHYQMPQYDRSWITTTTITRKAIHTDSLLYWGFWTPGELINADVLAFAQRLEDPQDPNRLIDQIVTLCFGLPITQESKDSLKEILLSGQATDDYWTNAWYEWEGDPDNEMNRSLVENRLKSLLQVMLQSAEYYLG